MRYLGVDQSLASTGWALLDYEDGKGVIEEIGMILTDPDIDIKGFEGTFQRATELFRQLRRVQARTLPSVTVHEMPVVPSARMPSKNREAGPSACMAVRIASEVMGIPVEMLNAQKVKKELTGGAKAQKKEVRAALEAESALTWEKSVGPMNEHTTDAVALAWVYAMERGEN